MTRTYKKPTLTKLTHTEINRFRECESCASKTESPELCPSCLHNRSSIGALKAVVEGLLSFSDRHHPEDFPFVHGFVQATLDTHDDD